MKIDILAIGKMKKGPEAQLLDTYLDRTAKAGRNLGITSVNLHTPVESKKPETDARKSDEAQQLLSYLPPNAKLIAFDEHGDDLNSRQFSKLLQDALDDGAPSLAFAIGGPDGHGLELLNRSNRTIRLGRLTWPHQLVRILAAEQIYRATTILNGHPYHRD